MLCDVDMIDERTEVDQISELKSDIAALMKIRSWHEQTIEAQAKRIFELNNRAVVSETLVRNLTSCTKSDMKYKAPGIEHLDLIPIVKTPGVYFLISKGDVVYVGQSKNVHVRINRHVVDKVFDVALYLPVAAPDLDRVEAHWINKLKPKYNNFVPG